MKKDERGFTIGICLEECPEEMTLEPVQAGKNEGIVRTPQDEEFPLYPKISLSTDEIVNVGNLVDEIKSRLDEIEETVHLHRSGPDEMPF